MLSRLAISLTTVLVLSSHGLAQTPDPEAIRVGDRWSYDVKDDVTGDLRVNATFVVAELTDKEITTRVSYRGKPVPQTIVFSRDWGRIDGGKWKHRPPAIGITTPLEPKKEWRSDSNAENMQSGDIFRASGKAKVLGQEQVTTPAGTFDTFRIETVVRLVNTKDQTKSMVENSTIWYAPSINRWAKKKVELRADGRVRDSFSEELTEYLPKS